MLPKWRMWLLSGRSFDVVGLLTRLATVQPLQGEEYQQRNEDEEHLVPATLVGEHDGRGGHRNNATGWLLWDSDQG